MKTQVESDQVLQDVEQKGTEIEGFVNLEKYFKKRLKKITGFLKREKEALVQETIHELRVEIKKIDALFDLVKTVNKNSKARKHFQPLTKKFKKAGKLRSIQVEFNLINSHFTENTNSNYLHQLHEIKQERRMKFENFISGDVIDQLKSTKKKTIPILRKIRKKEIVRYFNTKEREMIDLLEKKFFEERNLHIVRKNLKQFYLNIKNITPYTIDTGWANILNLMGEWHDRQVAFDQLMKAIYSSQLTSPEMDRLQKIKSEILTEKNNLHEQIVASYANQNKMYLIE